MAVVDISPIFFSSGRESALVGHPVGRIGRSVRQSGLHGTVYAAMIRNDIRRIPGLQFAEGVPEAKDLGGTGVDIAPWQYMYM